AAVLLYQLVQIGIRLNPLSRVTVPELPSLAPETANQPGPGPSIPAMPPVPAGKGSNNPVPSSVTNAPPTALAAGTKPTNIPPTLLSAGPGTNLPPRSGTNAVASQSPGSKTASGVPGPMAMGMPSGFNPNQRMMSPPQPVSLPAAIQARVDRIVESEILGPFIRPQPAALMGIAGDFAFVRAPTGQTGLVKEGDDLGGLKLLRIGTNRVLIEEQGQKKELTIFAGYGGESLLPKQDTSHETNK
ncbi:MAG TPA: hypothetical protein VN048_10565, partial [Verrucomicrobiae bacterium]|nr:hypothetical protein [Verrucomicrobiae bacterium]